VEIAKSLEENEHLYNNLEKILFLIPEDQQIDEMLQETAKKISRVHDYTESYKKLFMEYSDRTSGIRIAMKLGNILENLEQNYEEASDFYRIVFDRDRSHTAARDALIANLQKQEKWFELGLLFEQVAEYSDSKKDKIHWFNNAASVFLEKAVDAEKATENYRAILKIDRSDIDALNGIEKLLREAGNYNELVKILDAKACLIKDRSALISVYSDLAQIYEDKLNDPDKIIIYHNEILKLNPSARESLLKLEKLYMQKEKFSNLDKLYSGWLDIAEEQKEKIEIFSKKSQILEAYLDKTDDAVFLLKEILKFEPTNRFALMRLDEIHQKRHEFADLAEILKLRLSVALDESEIITLNYRIAELFADKLNAPETSLEHIKTVIGCSPDHEDARKFLEKMLSDSKVAMPVSGLLEPIYEKRGQFEDLINLLFRRIELFSRNEDKISTYLKISDIAEKTCNDPSRAIDTLGSALRLQPDQEDILTGMQEIAGKHSMFQQMADCIEKVADETGPDQMKISLGYRLAEIYRNNLGKPDKAAKILKKALEISPSSELLLRSLRSIYMEIEDFQELSPVLGRLSAIAADERNAINMEHAKLLHHKLHNIENSVDIYSSLLKSEPESEEAAMELTSLCTDSIMGARVIDILKNFYSDLKNYKSLLDILKIELSISHDNVAQFEILVSIAEIYAEKLSNFSQAMEHYGSALALNPSATNLLAKMEEVAKAKNLFEDYAKWLKNALENAKWKDVRVEILQRLGDVAHNQLRNEALAEETFREVVSIVPMNIQALNALESIFETGGKYKELMEILSKKAQMHLSQDEKKRVHKRMSEIALLRHERQKAADYLEQIIFIDPDDKDTLIKLATIYETTKNIKKYAETLIKISNLSDTSEDKINNKLEAARIFKESLNDRKIAINLFEEVLSIDPQNLGAFAQLDFLYEEEQDFDKQKKLILKRAESITDSNEKCRLFMRLSDIAENKIKRVIDAIEYLKKVREIDSGYIEAIDQLIRIYFNEEMWEDYFKICINKSEIVKDRDEKVDLLLKSSELALEKLKDEEYAAQLIEKALQENPDHSTALRMLAHIKEDKNELDEALKIYQKLIESSPEDKEKVMALTGYAKAILRKDEYTEKALAMLNEALAIDPENLATMELMREYLFKTEQWNELIKILIREMKKILKDADKATKAVEIARIYREKLKNSQEFLRWIDEANRLKHDDPEIQRALVDYFLELNDTKRVIEPLEWLVNYLEGKKRFKDLPYYSYNLGKIFKETGNIEKAAEYFKLCYKHDTGNIENNLVLAGIYMDAKEFEKAQKIYQPMFLKVDNLKDNEKIEIFCSLAKIFFNEGDRKKAKQYITRALNIDPEHKESKELMGKL
jgi:tetratricopeptide (TPR) repeat protein